MHIIMHMPTRNVYVSDEDQNLFQEAAELAGGFSPAVSEALREYVKRRKLMRGGAEQVEVDLRTDGIDHRVSFMGRRLVKVQRDHEQGCRIDTVYATARKQFAVVSRCVVFCQAGPEARKIFGRIQKRGTRNSGRSEIVRLKFLRIWMSCERPMVNLQNGSTQRCTSHPMRFWTFNT